MSNKKNDSNDPKLREVLDDLCMRFLVNLPAPEYESFERLFFAIESAHWFYEDFYRETEPTLPKLPLKQFAAKIFDHTTLLQRYSLQVGKLTSQFQAFKQEVPTCGAAMLNKAMDKVLLVKGWGPTARWGFPKGKLAKDETEIDAAIREVLEETGFDLTPHIDSSTYFIDSICAGRQCRIHVIPNISEETVFKTKTRKEISDIQWISVSLLPDSHKSVKIHNKSGLGPDGKEIKVSATSDQSSKVLFAHYGVAQFTKRLRSWIQHRKKNLQNNKEIILTPTKSVPMNGTVIEGEKVHQTDHRVNNIGSQDNYLSLDDLKALIGIQPETEHQTDRSSTRKTKIKSSPPQNKRSARKSRREGKRTEESLNRKTFGNDGGFQMNDSDRQKLFRQYVVETDRIAAEKGLEDDFWPVPYITSKDFADEPNTVEPVEEGRNKYYSHNNNASESKTIPFVEKVNGEVLQKQTRKKSIPVISSIESFSFDRKAIRASIMTVGSPVDSKHS